MQNEDLNARNPEVELGRVRWQGSTSPAHLPVVPFGATEPFSFLHLSSLGKTGRNGRTRRDVLQTPLIQCSHGPAFAGAGVHTLLPGLFSTGENDTEFSIKGTHIVNSSNTLTARYAFSRGKVRNDVQSGDNFTDQSARGSSVTGDHSLVAGWSSVISPTKINDVRVQWSQRTASLTPNAEGPMYEIPGIVTLGESYRLDQQRTERHAEVVETLQWSAGKHLFSVGASVHGVFSIAALRTCSTEFISFRH